MSCAPAMPPHSNPHFRADIEGLRAIAILLVIGAHYAIPGLSAGFIGVDIFFVISGYLITGILVREYEKTASINLARFYANRFRRLLPALAVVLIISCYAAFHILPQDLNLPNSISAAAASAWVSNIYFTFADRNYFDAGTQNNLFLHTWSLGVEEQFYLFWPLLLLALTTAAKKGTESRKQKAESRKQKAESRKQKIAVYCIGILAIISLTACMITAQAQPVIAFYMMPLRAWQFASGALAWLALRHHTLSNRQTCFVQWAGIALLLASMVFIHHHQTYPSLLTLLPTTGAGALLIAGASPRQNQTYIGVLLASRIMQGIGGISYSWYLWHWPVLILGESMAPIKGNLINTAVAISISLILALFSHKYIETPVRFGRLSHARGSRQLALFLTCIVLLNSQFIRWHIGLRNQQDQFTASPYQQARTDMPIIYAMDCDDWYHSAQVKHCIFGRAEAKKTAVLLGDSIGAQWFSVLTETLDPAQWKIVVYTKSSCPIVDETIYYDRIKRDYTECTQWRNLVIQDIQHITPDLLMIGSAGSYNLNETQWQDGTRRIIQKLVPSVKSIYLIESNPPLDIDGPSCLEQRRENHSLSHECKTPAVNQKYAAAAVSLIEVAKTELKTK